MEDSWLSGLAERPVIAAVREERSLRAAVDSAAVVVFLLSTTVLNVKQLVQEARQNGRSVFVHLDLMEGLTKDHFGLRWLAETAGPTGIISTRSAALTAARGLGLATVQRFFLLDSQSIHTGLDMAHNVKPDVIEVLPGLLPEVVRDVTRQVSQPVIAGGMITSEDQCRRALQAGARGVSTSNPKLWQFNPKQCRKEENP